MVLFLNPLQNSIYALSDALRIINFTQLSNFLDTLIGDHYQWVVWYIFHCYLKPKQKKIQICGLLSVCSSKLNNFGKYDCVCSAIYIQWCIKIRRGNFIVVNVLYINQNSTFSIKSKMLAQIKIPCIFTGYGNSKIPKSVIWLIVQNDVSCFTRNYIIASEYPQRVVKHFTISLQSIHQRANTKWYQFLTSMENGIYSIMLQAFSLAMLTF